MSARDVRVSRFVLHDRRYVVVSFERDGVRSGLAALSPTERRVVELALEGLDTASIAEKRGRSLHTVAHQLGSAYRKLGVSSRTELASALAASAQESS